MTEFGCPVAAISSTCCPLIATPGEHTYNRAVYRMKRTNCFINAANIVIAEFAGLEFDGLQNK